MSWTSVTARQRSEQDRRQRAQVLLQRGERVGRAAQAQR